jgi:membrane dipeptidase
VLVTHANAHALAPLERNKTDDVLRALAAGGGYIGASVYGPMLWDGDTTRKPGVDDYVRHVEYLAERVGIDHVGFGTDFGTGPDLATVAFERRTPRRWDRIDRFNEAFGEAIPERYLDEVRSHRDLPVVTRALEDRGWSDEHVRGYLGANFARIVAQIW